MSGPRSQCPGCQGTIISPKVTKENPTQGVPPRVMCSWAPAQGHPGRKRPLRKLQWTWGCRRCAPGATLRFLNSLTPPPGRRATLRGRRRAGLVAAGVVAPAGARVSPAGTPSTVAWLTGGPASDFRRQTFTGPSGPRDTQAPHCS